VGDVADAFAIGLRLPLANPQISDNQPIADWLSVVIASLLFLCFEFEILLTSEHLWIHMQTRVLFQFLSFVFQ
jgi:hypothetical protein